MEIIDSLVVLLSLDATGVKKGQKDAEDALKKTGAAADKTQKEIEAANKRVAESYKKVQDGILALTGAIVGAVAGADFVQYLTKNDQAVGKLATNVGSTTQEVTTLRGAFRLMGAQASEADNALTGMNKILEDLKNTGTSGALFGLQMTGTDIGRLREATTYYDRYSVLADALSKKSMQDAQYWGAQAGFSPEMVYMLHQGSDAFRKLWEQAEKFSHQSPEDTAAAARRTVAFARLDLTMESLGRHISTEVSPAFEGFANTAQSVLGYLGGNTPVATGMVVALTAAFVSLNATSLAAVITKVGALTGGLSASAMAANSLLGALSGIAKVLGLAGLTHAVLSFLDPNDSLGAAIDREIPGAAAVDNFFGHMGMGRTYAQQDAYYASKKTGPAMSDDMKAIIADAETKWGLPPGLVASVIDTESRGKVGAVSQKGAMGLMQLMPATAAALGVTDPFDPAQNIGGGAHLLHDLLTATGGDLSMALAAYNWGIGNLAKQGFANRPPETRNYVDSVLAGLNQQHGAGRGSISLSFGDVHVKTTASHMSGVGADLHNSVLSKLALASPSNTALN